MCFPLFNSPIYYSLCYHGLQMHAVMLANIKWAAPQWWHLTFKVHQMCVFPQFNSPVFTNSVIYAPINSECMQWCYQMSNKHKHIDDTWLLECTYWLMYVFLQFNSHQASHIIIYASLDFCNNTRPLKTHHISDVQYSCFQCCTKFLISVLYKIPLFQWCTVFLHELL